MDLSDERLHRRTLNWNELVRDGFDPRTVMIEAQKQGMYKLAQSAQGRMKLSKKGKNND